MRNCSVNTAAGVIVCAVLCVIGSLEKPGLSQNTSMKNQESLHPEEEATRAAVERFNNAFNRHDSEAVAALLTEDTVFEDTSPAPDGRRIEGKAAVADFWRAWFVRNSDARFDAEEFIVSGNRVVVPWVYHKMRNGQPWHLRGVDIFTVRDGKIAAKLAYVKG
jgi:ketosteroid isomerase-like protein